MINIKLVDADDWWGMYIDGQLKTEDHSLDVSLVLQILHDLGIVNYEGIVVEKMGNLPDDISEVKTIK